MVLEIWSDPEITAQTGYEYTRSIQFQCLGRATIWALASCALQLAAGTEKDGITFTGINFLSRVPIVECLQPQQVHFGNAVRPSPTVHCANA